MIQRMTIAELSDDKFLERVKRSAAYFEQTLDKILSKPLSLVLDIKSQNKLAMKRLTENYGELRRTATGLALTPLPAAATVAADVYHRHLPASEATLDARRDG